MSNIKYSIVVLAYNEERYIGRTLDTLRDYLRSVNYIDHTEVVVVTANSPDDTAEIVKRKLPEFRYYQFVEPGVRVGKGRDTRSGVLASRGDYVIFMDGDMATPLHHIEPTFARLEAGADMVIGVRQLAKMHKTLLRRISSLGLNVLIRAFIGWGIPDSQCGFKGFSRRSAEELFSRLTILGWGFDFELLTIARQYKLKIAKEPIPDWTDPKGENAGLVGDSLIGSMVKTMGELITVTTNKLTGKYK